jgi:RNA polymerase primary sigma factor
MPSILVVHSNARFFCAFLLIIIGNGGLKMSVDWQSYLLGKYPGKIIPLSLKDTYDLLRAAMNHREVKREKFINYSLLGVREILEDAGFSCNANYKANASWTGVTKIENSSIDDNIQSLPTSAFDDDFDDAEFQELLEKDSIQVKKTFKDNSELIADYRSGEDRNSFAYQELFRVNQRLVQKIAAKYVGAVAGTIVDFDDLVGYGNEGLEKAIERYDFAKETQFSTYAVFWIKQSITRKIQDEAYTIRIPVHLQEKMRALKKIEHEQVAVLGRVDPQAVCQKMEITLKQYQDLHQYLSQFRSMASLDFLVNNSASEDSTGLENFISSDQNYNANLPINVETIVQNEDAAKQIDLLMDRVLTDRERAVVRMRCGFENDEEMTLEQVGTAFGVTRERIRQIEKKALIKLNKNILKEGKSNYGFE